MNSHTILNTFISLFENLGWLWLLKSCLCTVSWSQPALFLREGDPMKGSWAPGPKKIEHRNFLGENFKWIQRTHRFAPYWRAEVKNIFYKNGDKRKQGSLSLPDNLIPCSDGTTASFNSFMGLPRKSTALNGLSKVTGEGSSEELETFLAWNLMSEML